MPVPKAAFDDLLPCEFYTPGELLEPDLCYTVEEIARLLQGLPPEADLEPATESVLVDWAVPWILVNADDLVVAEPRDADDPGRYGLRA